MVLDTAFLNTQHNKVCIKGTKKDKGSTQLNGQEDKKVDDDAQGLTSKR